MLLVECWPKPGISITAARAVAERSVSKDGKDRAAAVVAITIRHGDSIARGAVEKLARCGVIVRLYAMRLQFGECFVAGYRGFPCVFEGHRLILQMRHDRSEEPTSELQSLMPTSFAGLH